jgi:DNA repair protein RecN (Recombination protein N)
MSFFGAIGGRSGVLKPTMLQFLRIRNLALLDRVELEFEGGFVAVTGETGAGKSILLGAISLLSGGRADRALIRQGAETCEVEGGLFFENPSTIDGALDSCGLPPCEDGTLIIRRQFSLKKAARVTVNGSLATVANLQSLGEIWVDFHGPNEPRRLLKPSSQIELVDAFGQLETEVTTFTAQYREWKQTGAEIDRLSGEERLAPDQINFLRDQIKWIDSLEISEESIADLERDFQRMTRSQDILDYANGLAEGLAGDEGLLGPLAALIRQAGELTEADPSAAGMVNRLNSISIEVEDLGREFASLASDLSFDPETVEEVKRRMNAWMEVRRRYGSDVSGVLDARAKMERRIDDQGDIEGTLEKLRASQKELEKKARVTAAALSRKRIRFGADLIKRTKPIMTELGFRKAELSVVVRDSKELGPRGDSWVELLFSPNVGEPLMSLARIASSGELARVLLALKTVLAEVDDIPVLIFDEVDSNVGGETGRAVGAKMAAIAGRHQVFCVTHLPQVAAFGTQHFVVEKDQSGSRSSVSIKSIHDQPAERIDELARMLGDRKAESAVAHARKLLGQR